MGVMGLPLNPYAGRCNGSHGSRLDPGGWRLVAGGWWLVAGGWWLVADGCACLALPDDSAIASFSSRASIFCRSCSSTTYKKAEMVVMLAVVARMAVVAVLAEIVGGVAADWERGGAAAGYQDEAVGGGERGLAASAGG